MDIQNNNNYTIINFNLFSGKVKQIILIRSCSKNLKMGLNIMY